MNDFFTIIVQENGNHLETPRASDVSHASQPDACGEDKALLHMKDQTVHTVLFGTRTLANGQEWCTCNGMDHLQRLLRGESNQFPGPTAEQIIKGET